MKASFTARIFLGILALLLLNSLLLGALLFTSFRNNVLKEKQFITLEKVARAAAFSVETISNQPDAETFSYLSGISRETKMRITLIRKDGKVIFDSDNDIAEMDDHGNRPEIISAFSGQVASLERYSTTHGENRFYFTVPLFQKGDIHVLRLSSSLSVIKNSAKAMMLNILTYIVLVLALSILLGLLLSKKYSKPFSRLLELTRSVSNGDFSIRMHGPYTGDLKNLSRGFNNMVKTIGTLVGKLQQREKELSTILSSMEDGVLYTDSDGKILMSNDAFSELSIPNSKYIENEQFWDSVSSGPLKRFLMDHLRDKKSGMTQMELNNRTVTVTAIPVKTADNMLFLIHDLSEALRFGKLKKDLVANVSHELRTPLTSIRGFAETLEEDLNGKSKKYAQIIRRNSERLINIVSDLLTLSKLEQSDEPPSLSPVDLCSFISNNAKVFSRRLKTKGLYFKVHHSGDPRKVEVDPYRFEQVITNLIDNAVKYTEKGGITVEIRYLPKTVEISIKDTGIGIAEDKLQDIFRRFYVTDKSRSREMGGTGLGLSIVKHIIKAQGGRVYALSESGNGSEFIIVLHQKSFK